MQKRLRANSNYKLNLNQMQKRSLKQTSILKKERRRAGEVWMRSKEEDEDENALSVRVWLKHRYGGIRCHFKIQGQDQDRGARCIHGFDSVSKSGLRIRVQKYTHKSCEVLANTFYTETHRWFVTREHCGFCYMCLT